jgi:DNA N-6-adenine-methyltransferase (Dam)
MPISRARIWAASDDAEFYTPPDIIELVKKLFGGEIDLDPASCREAQRVVQATQFRTVCNDGLKCEWRGRVFLNSPYGRAIDAWIKKLADEFEAGHVTEAVALLPSRTGTAWFQKLDRFPRCFVRGRPRFWGPNASVPTFDSVIVYLGPHLERFAETFAGVGSIFVRYRAVGR